MLTIEPPIYQLRGATVLRDHADPDQFYVLPPAVHLARGDDGKLDFHLFKYRHDLTDNPALDPTRALGAGIVELVTEAAVDDLDRLAADVGSAAGRPAARLSPVLFRAGEARLILAHGSGDAMVEDVAALTPAPLVSPHRAVFSLALSAEGASLFEQAARGGQIPAGVAYQLRFLALTPALSARVTMDYDRIYDRFSASVGFTYYVSLKLDLDLAWLVEHDFVKIEIISFTDQADQQRQQQLVMDLVKARIQADFFRSGIPPKTEDGIGGPLAQMLGGLVGKGEVTSASALFVLKAKYEVVRENKTFELLYDGRTAVELVHVAGGLLSTMTAATADTPQDLDIREIDLDDPFFSALDVQVVSAIDFDELADLKEAAVQLEHGDHRDAFSLTPAARGPFHFRAPLAGPRDDEYRYTVEYHFDPGPAADGGPALVTAGPFPSRFRVLTIDPLAHFRYRRLRVLLGPVDPARVPRARVELRFPAEDGGDDLARGVVELDAQHPEVVFRHHFPMAFSTLRLLARTDWQDPQGVWHAGADEEEVDGESFVALGPYRDLLSLSVQPVVDWSKVTQVMVEIRYQDGDYLEDKSLVFTAQAKAGQTVAIPLLDRAHRAYRYRQTVVHTDGTVAEIDWADADQAMLLVGHEVLAGGDVRVVWVGAPGDALGLRVDFWAVDRAGDEQNVAVFLAAGEKEKIATLPLDADGHLHYRYQIQRVTAQGQDVLRVGEDKSNLLVVQAGS